MHQATTQIWLFFKRAVLHWQDITIIMVKTNTRKNRLLIGCVLNVVYSIDGGGWLYESLRMVRGIGGKEDSEKALV